MSDMMNWLKVSNRQYHAEYGLIIYVVICAFNFFGGCGEYWSIFSALEVVFGAATALEFKDKMYGTKFDWLDVAATMFYPVICSIIVLICLIVCAR